MTCQTPRYVWKCDFQYYESPRYVRKCGFQCYQSPRFVWKSVFQCYQLPRYVGKCGFQYYIKQESTCRFPSNLDWSVSEQKKKHSVSPQHKNLYANQLKYELQNSSWILTDKGRMERREGGKEGWREERTQLELEKWLRDEWSHDFSSKVLVSWFLFPALTTTICSSGDLDTSSLEENQLSCTYLCRDMHIE